MRVLSATKPTDPNFKHGCHSVTARFGCPPAPVFIQLGVKQGKGPKHHFVPFSHLQEAQ